MQDINPTVYLLKKLRSGNKEASKTMIVVHAKMQIQATAKEQFLAEVKTLLAASRQEEGNISYELLEHTEQPDTYIMIEVWQNQEAIEQHNASSHFQAFVSQAPQFMAAPLQVQAYEATSLQA